MGSNNRLPGSNFHSDCFSEGMMRRLLSFVSVFVVLISTLAALPPALAQQADIVAINKRFLELYAASDYPAAAVEAQKQRSGCASGPITQIMVSPSTSWAL
jgi:hypothetical protein